MEEQIHTQTPNIKLCKMTKGYNWEIRISNDDLNSSVNELEKLNEKMKEKFGKNIKIKMGDKKE
jgi:hypothetical protein